MSTPFDELHQLQNKETQEALLELIIAAPPKKLRELYVNLEMIVIAHEQKAAEQAERIRFLEETIESLTSTRH
jgi:hypothetical protein